MTLEKDALVIRDLMALLALPSLWLGKDLSFVMQTMMQAVERITPLCASFARVETGSAADAVCLLRVADAQADDTQQAAWMPHVAVWQADLDVNAHVLTSASPLGALRVLRLSIGYGSRGGHVWFASGDPLFPSLSQLAVLRAAASLAGSGLHASLLAAEREEAGRAKDEFLAMLGHELRNPLAPIVTALGMIRRKQQDLPREYEVIERQVGHLRRLVNDLLDVARVTRGSVELQLKPVNLKMVLTRSVEDVQALIEERRHSLKLNLAASKSFVEGDETRLAQVFTNLLTNAAKYTDPGGQIEVSMVAGNGKVTCIVQDNGSGISPRLFPKLFNIFEQGTSTIDRRKGGLGIGLALVKSFVERHGGTVSVHSEGIGKGSRFLVELPLLENHALAAPAELPRDVQVRPERILIVDDNLDALETLQSCLLACGHEVWTASNANDALILFSRWRPTVAILDIGLPIIDGYELARRLRNLDAARDLRLFALTGYGQARDRMLAINAGFDAHFVKPVVLDELYAAIHNRP